MAETRISLEQSILEFLKTSSLPQEEKEVVTILLPIMEMEKVERIYNALKEEHDKMSKLEDKEKRINLKYKIMAEKLESIEKNKTAA